MSGHPLADARVVDCGWCEGGRFVWCVTKNGKRIPINPEPDPAGNVEVVSGWSSVLPVAGMPMVSVHKGPPGMFGEWVAYMPHHATCPGVGR